MAIEIKIYRPSQDAPSLSELSFESLKKNNLSAMKNCHLYAEYKVSSKNPSDFKNEIVLTPGDIAVFKGEDENTEEYFYVDIGGNLRELVMNGDTLGMTEGEETVLEVPAKKKATFDIDKTKPYVGKLKEATCPICGKRIVCLGVEEKKMGKENLYVSTFFCDKCEATVCVETKTEK